MKDKWIGLCLAVSALCLFSFSALLDPFLNLWDERFHALVAKNLMSHPLEPTLYNHPMATVLYEGWDRSHIWLHKQPLFLWQIALSFKLFGLSEFSLRLPNIVLGTILVLITFRSGTLLQTRRTGYFAALLVLTNFYFFELISGRQPVDHNDVSFLVYVSLSIWALAEYHYSKRTIWIVMIGVFAGCAILCKWLVGLLVYLGWMVLKLIQKRYKASDYIDLAGALAITILVSLPWQLLTFAWYPAEATHELAYNSRHFLKVIEGHGGDYLFHLMQIKPFYGVFAPYLIVPALFFLTFGIRNKAMGFAWTVMVVAVYLFFTLAATKMPSFTLICMMMISIALAALLDGFIRAIEKYSSKQWLKAGLFVASITLLILSRFNLHRIEERHALTSETNSYGRMLQHNKQVFQSLNLPENSVIFNVKGRHFIESMFYSGLPSYGFIPNIEQYQELKDKGNVIALFETDRTLLPYYLTEDDSVIIIPQTLEGYE